MLRIPISSVLLLSLSLLPEVSLVPLYAVGYTEADNTRESFANKSEVEELSTHEKQLIQMSPLYSIFNVFPSMQPDEDYEGDHSFLFSVFIIKNRGSAFSHQISST